MRYSSMKHKLLILFLMPVSLFAQISVDGLFPKNVAESEKIKSVQATAIFITSNDRDKPDTGMVEIQQYDVYGNMIQRDYSCILEKNHFTMKSIYSYQQHDQLSRIVKYENGVIIDSTLINSPTSSVRYAISEGKRIIHTRNDSISNETIISGTDTIVRKNKIVSSKQEEQKDDFYSGKFEKKILVHDSIHHIDSIAYLDKNGECILIVLNSYDNMDRLLSTDYYNKQNKSFSIYSPRYNSKMNMIFYVPVNKTNVSYQIIREYNERGLLSKVTRISSKKGNPRIVTYYDYSFYK